jgi:hypothetical protein
VIVFHEPHEDAGQHPRHGNLIEIIFSPDFKGLGGAAPSFDLMKRIPQPGADLDITRRTGEQVLGQVGDQFAKFWQHCLDVHRINHEFGTNHETHEIHETTNRKHNKYSRFI